MISKTLRMLVLLIAAAPTATAQNNDYLILQSTTSTQNAGLYDVLIPMFEADTGIQTRVVAVGTGQAIRNAGNCDGDILLVHSIEDETAFIAKGYGLYRRNVMYNDYVIIGPQHDPAGLENAGDINAAMDAIAKAHVVFVSRGDDSGTHKAEKRLWNRVRIDPNTLKAYRESGSGMGATLTVTVELDGYTLSDRSTWTSFANKQQHRILFEGDPPLFNQYSVIPVNPAHCPEAHHEGAIALAEWLVSEKGQRVIAGYKKNGVQLFFPNARP